MRISSKGRYGLAAMIYMAENADGDSITIASISERLGISKIYLEQVFSLLKRAGLVLSIKGAQGGYRLARPAKSIDAHEILMAVEQSLFEKTESSVSKNAQEIEDTMQGLVFEPAAAAVSDTLSKVTLYALAAEAEKRRGDGPYMFYI